MVENWEITAEDADLLSQIVERAKRLFVNYPDDWHTLCMDLNACHSNGCPLDFAGLLKADDYEFGHDILDIRKAIDRRTGKLTEDCFMPRFALANKLTEGA